MGDGYTPFSRWHCVQWQYPLILGGALSAYFRAPQKHPPVSRFSGDIEETGGSDMVKGQGVQRLGEADGIVGGGAPHGRLGALTIGRGGVGAVESVRNKNHMVIVCTMDRRAYE